MCVCAATYIRSDILAERALQRLGSLPGLLTPDTVQQLVLSEKQLALVPIALAWFGQVIPHAACVAMIVLLEMQPQLARPAVDAARNPLSTHIVPSKTCES